MPLPIIILFERHNDTVSKQSLIDVLNDLKKIGYSTLCNELPETDEKTILDTCSKHIKASDILIEKLHEVLPGKINISAFSQLSLFEAQGLIEKTLNIPSNLARDYAALLKETAGNKKGHELIKKCIAEGLEVRGVDHPNRHHMTQKDILGPEREKYIAQNIIKLFSQKKGLICFFGGFHAEGILTYLSEAGLGPQVLAYTVTTSIPYNIRPVIEELTSMKPLREDNNELIFIDTPEQLKAFNKKLLADVENGHRYQKTLESQSTTSLINKKTKLNFIPQVRANHYVDATLNINDLSISETKELVTNLKNLNMNPAFGFFNQKKHIVIPNVNVGECVDKYLSNCKT
jgi:hypothetical protein